MSFDKRYYFDTNALIKYYAFKDEKGIEITQKIVDNFPVFISNLTSLEYFKKLMDFFRKKEINKSNLKKLTQRFYEDTENRFILIANPENIFFDAQQLILTYGKTNNISANDALHICIAKCIPNGIIVTSDRVIKNICDKIQLATFDPESEEIL